MLLNPSRRKTISQAEILLAAGRLEEKIEKPRPDTVVYIKKGGEAFGLAIAEVLGIPAVGIDIGYPLSKTLNSSPKAVRTLAWPAKELVYKFSKPRLRSNSNPTSLGDLGRVLLVDDSASTGRSIRAAVRALEANGIDRSLVKVAVFRCGPRAEPLVDYFETRERVLFDNITRP